ncbi:unnamed protein product [Rhizophagus irregularis]|nr:unnamed protein product [Rhizophagus irregularis]
MAKDLIAELPSVAERQNKIHIDIDNNPFLEESEKSDIILSIDDIPRGLTFEDKNSAGDIYIGEINVSSLFRNYHNQSLKLARKEGLLIESNVYEILSLPSTLLISPNSHSPLMIDLFGSTLLEQIHEEFVPTQKIELDPLKN